MYLWKRFQFFEASDDPGADSKKSPAAAAARIFHQFEPVCSAAGQGYLIYGDGMGVVRALGKDMKLTHNFKAFKERVVALAQPKNSGGILVALGHDILDVPTLKVFALNSTNDKGDRCEATLRELQVSCRGAPPAPTTASSLAVLGDLNRVAVGTEQGTVFLIGGDLLKKPVFQVLIERGPPVTGLHYVEPRDSMPSLFVVTEKTVDSFFVRNRNQKMSLEKEFGGGPGCSAVDPGTSQLLVGRDQAVYRYAQDTKGICYGFHDDKRQVHWFGDYLVLVSRDTKRSDTVTLYDLKNKLIAFTRKTDVVATVSKDWGKLFVVTKSGKVLVLAEKSLRAKLAILQRMHMYSIAISLARSKKCGEDTVMGIYKESADHKRVKGDYAGAMADYIRTIGHLQPSYVIRQFLEAQRIVHLSAYLEALHDRELAQKDHTTLLLKCYTKLKQPEKLDAFIQAAETESANGGRDMRSIFDVEAAIEVCHRAGHFEQARSLSKRWGKHEWYLRVTVEDLEAFGDAIEYIRAALPSPALRGGYLLKYGRQLMATHAKEATGLLAGLCGRKTERKERPPAERFLQIFLGRPRRLMEFLSTVVDEVPSQSAVVYNMLLELYLTIHLYPKEGSKGTTGRDQLVRKTKRTPEAKLTPEQLSEREANHTRAMQLLKSQQAVYDVNQALMAAKTLHFEKGMIYLYERLRLFGEILQYYMDTNNHKRLIRACIKNGASDPNLWVQALKYFAEKPEPCEDEIAQILDHIEDPKINLAPLMVLQILSSHASKPFAVIKDYVIRILQRERDLIEEDEKAIAKIQGETSSMRKEIEELSTKPTTFMPSRDLMLPAVHFLCKHSYHEQVIGSRECPKCSPEYRNVMEIKEQVRQSASQHEQFFKMLEGSNDGFGVVAEYFGRGILEVGKGDK